MKNYRKLIVNVGLAFFVLLSLFVFVCLILDAFCWKVDFSFNLSEYGKTFSNWFSLCLSVINVMVLVLVNQSVKESSERLNEREIVAEKNKLKASIRFERFCKFREDWQLAYENLQNGGDRGNQEAFDSFKGIFQRYISEDSLLENSVNSIKVVGWWNDTFSSVDEYFEKNEDFEANEVSYEWANKKRELFAELLGNMFNAIK